LFCRAASKDHPFSSTESESLTNHYDSNHDDDVAEFGIPDSIKIPPCCDDSLVNNSNVPSVTFRPKHLSIRDTFYFCDPFGETPGGEGMGRRRRRHGLPSPSHDDELENSSCTSSFSNAVTTTPNQACTEVIGCPMPPLSSSHRPKRQGDALSSSSALVAVHRVKARNHHYRYNNSNKSLFFPIHDQAFGSDASSPWRSSWKNRFVAHIINAYGCILWIIHVSSLVHSKRAHELAMKQHWTCIEK
jgi:hypothetical protein